MLAGSIAPLLDNSTNVISYNPPRRPHKISNLRPVRAGLVYIALIACCVPNRHILNESTIRWHLAGWPEMSQFMQLNGSDLVGLPLLPTAHKVLTGILLQLL